MGTIDPTLTLNLQPKPHTPAGGEVTISWLVLGHSTLARPHCEGVLFRQAVEFVTGGTRDCRFATNQPIKYPQVSQNVCGLERNILLRSGKSLLLTFSFAYSLLVASVNAIGKQPRYLVGSRLTRWCLMVYRCHAIAESGGGRGRNP